MKIPADITGVVCKIEAELGKNVAEGDTLLIVESMKMEIPVTSPIAGVVKAIHVSEGDMVKESTVVVELL